VVTRAVLAWSPRVAIDQEILERYDGSVGDRPDVAYFSGAADALQAAAEWQRHTIPGTD
jgi:hypothetical protein